MSSLPNVNLVIEQPKEDTTEKFINISDLYSTKGWNRKNYRVIRYYVSFLSYMCLIYHFYYFKLKQIEGYWSWSIIVFSSFSSALSLFQYHEEQKTLELMVKICLTVFSLIITLISAWVKKQNYVERISEIGKYSVKLSKLKNKIKAELENPIQDRITYLQFTTKYKKDIVEFISNRPLISPYEWKETTFTISKYYPELAAYEFPWNKIENYGSHIMETYRKLKYNSLWHRIKYCYYCKSKCFCKDSDSISQNAKDIMEQDIKFYQSLPKFDLDYNPYHLEEGERLGLKLRKKFAAHVEKKCIYSDSEGENDFDYGDPELMKAIQQHISNPGNNNPTSGNFNPPTGNNNPPSSTASLSDSSDEEIESEDEENRGRSYQTTEI